MRKLLRQTGRGDMGDVTDPESPCRFWIDSDWWQLVFIRARFETIDGSTVDNADLSIKVDHQELSNLHKYLLAKMQDMGTGTDGNTDMNLRIMPEEAEHWQFPKDARLVLEWANPDPGNVRWIVEVELKSVERAA